ncbi:MAG: PP2C family protein-serine/threonine phosphatase [Anaerolineales bacterium]
MSDFLKNIFGGKENPEGEESPLRDSSDLSTQPTREEQALSSFNMSKSPHSPFIFGTGSSIGMQRDHNEDALFAMSTILVSNSIDLPTGLFIVADGMGGHLHGEIASEVAVEAMSRAVISKLHLFSQHRLLKDQDDPVEKLMSDGIHAAHKAILEQAPGGGSTLTALLILDDQLTIAHIGDSRAYHINSNGSAKVLTTDHSLVQRLQDLGQITSDEAAIHPQRNVLYRALGQAEKIDEELITNPIPSSGYLVICSDGLWGLVSDNEMVGIIVEADSLQSACQKLILAANAAGGPDNITVIIIQIPEKNRV